MSQDRGRISKIKWVYISGVSFLLFSILAILLIFYAEKLGQYGITKSFYYIILIPVGLCAAGFLFGAMHSHAKYVGKNSYGQLELTGPVVIFCLVVGGGFYLAEPESGFLLTVRVMKNNNQIVKNGSVILDLGSQRLKRDIGENGEVLFADLSTKFIDKEITVIPEVEGYKAKDPNVKISKNKTLYIELIPENYNTEIRGTVIDVNGNPVKGVKVNFDSGLAICESNDMGNFKLNLPAKAGTTMLVTATLNGQTGFRDFIAIPSTGSITISYNVSQ